MDSDQAMQRLLSVLADRDIGLGKEDLAWLFDTPETRHDMVAWVNEYLVDETLLTPEELDLCSRLDGRELDSRHHLSPRPVDDNDLVASIETLESSTLAIDQQCAILEAQLEAMKELRRLNDPPLPSDSASGTANNPRQRQVVDAETERLSDALNERVTSLCKKTEADMILLETAAPRQLEKDDRLLDGLQKVMASLEISAPTDTQSAEVVKLCKALRSLQASVVKGRANRTFSAALRMANERSDGNEAETRPDEAHEISTLSAELDSLMEEVDSVLEMAITSRYQHPILLQLSKKQRQDERERQQWLSYVETALKQMTSHLQDLSAHAQELRASGSALEVVSAALQKSTLPTQVANPVRPPIASRLASDKSLRHLVLPTTAPTDPTSEFLRHQGIQTHKAETLEAALETASSIRKARLANLTKSTEQNLTDQVSSSLDLADTQLQSLLRAVHVYSPYGGVSLTDREMKLRLAELDQGLEALGDRLRGIDLQGMTDRERERLAAVLNAETEA